MHTNETTFNSEGLDQNLLPGTHPQKKNKSTQGSDSSLEQSKATRKFRRTVKMTSYILVVFLSTVFFYIIKLPADLIGRNTLALLSQQTPYEWRAEKTNLSFIFGPKISFENIQIIHRFPPMNGPQQKFRLEKLSIKPNLLQMIPLPGLRTFTPSANFSLEAFQGSVSGSVSMGTNMAIDIEAENLRLDKMDFLKNYNVFLKGEISSFHLQIEAPNSRFSNSQGLMELNIKRAHLDPTSFSQGMMIPELDLGTMEAKANIKSGKFMLEKINAGDAKADMEFHGDGLISLKDPLDYSDLDLRFRLKLSDKLVKAAPTLEGMLPLIAAKRPDGFYGSKLSGPMIAPQMPSPYAGN